MKKLDLVFPVVAITFVSLFIGLGFFHYHYSAAVMRFPVLIGGLVVLFCLLLVPRILHRTEPDEADVLETEIARSNLGQFLGACLWLLAILPALYLFGFPVGVPAYIFAYMKAHGEGWLLSAAMAAMGFVVTYFVFMKLLGIPLPGLPVFV